MLALICAIALCLVLVSTPVAHAQGLLGGRQFGALMAAGLMATSIVLNSLNVAGVPGHFDSLMKWVNEPTYVQTDGTFFDYNWPEPSESISEYLNRSTIQVKQGVTTIDGVTYDQLWISPEGAGSVKANAFDFKTKWNILSNNVGTLATGAGFFDEFPVFDINGNYVTQEINLPNAAGNYRIPGGTIEFTPNTSGGQSGKFRWKDGTSSNVLNWYDSMFPTTVYAGNFPSTIFIYNTVNGYGQFNRKSFPASDYVEDEFEFLYTSGIVPATEADIPEDYGLNIQIPHDQLSTFYNLYPQYNVDNSTINIQQDQINIDELIESIFAEIESMEDIRASWTEGEEEPEPEPPAPVEDILEGINTLIGQQSTQISQNQHQQAIEQQQLQQQQAISQDTGTISQTLQNVTTLPDVDEELPDFKFDLRELFPFCIPFDIYRLLQSFDAEPVAPHVQLPFYIESLNFRYNMDLDFSVFNPVAQVLRTCELILYALGLAWATGKVIKW